MSLLLAHGSESGFMIVTDELVVRSGTGEPLGRTSKLLPLPHLGAAVIGTGFKHLGESLFVRGLSIDGDARTLAKAAPEVLGKAWASIVEANGADAIAARRHLGREHVLGFHLMSGRPRAAWFVFDAPSFVRMSVTIPPAPQAARIVNGAPSWWPPGEVAEKFDTLDEMVDLAVRIKANYDDPTVAMEFCGSPHNLIGGGLWASTLTYGPAGPVFTTQRVVDFGDIAGTLPLAAALAG